MKLYIVTTGKSADYSIIEEYELDGGMNERVYTEYSTTLFLVTGEMVERETPVRQRWGIPQVSSYIHEECGMVIASSHKSAEHAYKVAVEARQKWLREKKTA